MAANLELSDIQGLVARGYGRLRAARLLLLVLGEPAPSRGWLASVAAQVTTADVDPRDTAIHLAFAPEGLRNLGLPEAVLAGFSNEFREGMTTPHRQRVLGDFDANAPERWRWGGPTTPAVHAVLMLYGASAAELEALAAVQVQALEAAGLKVLATLDATDIGDVEPFGFRDGISQPLLEGLGKEGPAFNVVQPGEFVLGYKNEYGLLTDRPLVPAATDAGRILPRDAAGSDARDLGRNGTYLVVRQLEQDVAGFWRCLDGITRAPDGTSRPTERTKLAAKMVGRWPGGAPLATSPDRDDPAQAKSNDFRYHAQDADGLGCPIGAHVRRTNPRDSLDPNPGSDGSIALNRRHRILRRGRAYGPYLPAEQALAGADGVERGLHFICLAANIARQFEFIQHTWANNPKFAALYDDVDPIMGARGPGGATFSMPATPVRKRVTGLPSFVTVRGGGYFFLPGIRALRYLSSL